METIRKYAVGIVWLLGLMLTFQFISMLMLISLVLYAGEAREAFIEMVNAWNGIW